MIRVILSLALTHAIAGLATLEAADNETKRFVVVLYPEANDGSPGNAQADRGIRAALRSAYLGQVEIHNEYLDVSRFPDSDYQAELAKFLRRKYEGRQADVVIGGLASGLDYAEAHRDDIFPAAPIVCLAVDDGELTRRHIAPDVIGVPIHMDIASTVQVALDLLPRTRHVFVVVGRSRFDRQWEEEARRQLQPLESQVEVVFLAGLPLAELLDQVEHLPEHSVIHYMHIFEDGTGSVHVPAEALELIAAKANAPVFSHVESYLGRGTVGGRMFSFERAGHSAGQLAARVLHGEPPESIGIQQPLANAHVFDWRQLRRWNLRERDLPPGSDVRYRSPSVWETYRWQLTSILAVCLLQGLMIAGLLLQRSRRARAEVAWRAAEQQLGQSQAELRELTGKLLSAEESERRRVARELHDDLGQELALLSVELDLLQQSSPPDVSHLLEKVGSLSTRVKQLSSSVHDLSHQLHPMKLEQLGLAAALGGLCKELSAAHNLVIRFATDEPSARLSPNNALCLYRIAQEALQNVVKHSGAEQASVTLRSTVDLVSLEIVDEGQGFDMQSVAETEGIGLCGMRERVRLVKGTIDIESQPGEGTCVRVQVPH